MRVSNAGQVSADHFVTHCLFQTPAPTKVQMGLDEIRIEELLPLSELPVPRPRIRSYPRLPL